MSSLTGALRGGDHFVVSDRFAWCSVGRNRALFYCSRK
jgi:hypothetical protein